MKWIQKLIIGLVAVATLGIINPTHDIWNALSNKENVKEFGPSLDSDEQSIALGQKEEIIEKVDFISGDAVAVDEAFIVRAKELSYEKFGSKIGPTIREEFDEKIFPEINKVVKNVLNDESIHNQTLRLSERPTGNYSEKIFHIINENENKDVIRFHVRTEKRPQDGYYFNFHYHKADDNFSKHFSIGDIYWSKNTPPKWLS